MKINLCTFQNNKKRIIKNLKYTAVALPLLTGIQTMNAQTVLPQQDTYQAQDSTITPNGIDITNNYMAPSSIIKIGDKTCVASIVVDISKNILYIYDAIGQPQKAYKVASGKKSTPTHTGIKKIINVEKYPYKSAPVFSKRHRHPKDYGPKLLVLCPVDTKNDSLLTNDGQFIHGTNNPESIGNYASKGCIRMDNTAIKEVANFVKKGQYVVIIH